MCVWLDVYITVYIPILPYRYPPHRMENKAKESKKEVIRLAQNGACDRVNEVHKKV